MTKAELRLFFEDNMQEHGPWRSENVPELNYREAVEITDPNEAADYFEQLVRYYMSVKSCSREEAERVQRSNLGYFSGYYDQETRERVERLFNCVHPIFGSSAHPPSPEEAFRLGSQMGEAMKNGASAEEALKAVVKPAPSRYQLLREETPNG